MQDLPVAHADACVAALVGLVAVVASLIAETAHFIDGHLVHGEQPQARALDKSFFSDKG